MYGTFAFPTLFGLLRSLFHGFGQANAARIACVGFFEFAFAAPACVDLGLDHPKGSVHLACGCFSLFCAQDCTSVADRGTIGRKKRLGLIFVNVHEAVLRSGKR